MLLLPPQPGAHSASAASNVLPSTDLTTNAVLVECGDGFSELNDVPTFSMFLEDFVSAPLSTVLPVQSIDHPVADLVTEPSASAFH